MLLLESCKLLRSCEPTITDPYQPYRAYTLAARYCSILETKKKKRKKRKKSFYVFIYCLTKTIVFFFKRLPKFHAKAHAQSLFNLKKKNKVRK